MAFWRCRRETMATLMPTRRTRKKRRLPALQRRRPSPRLVLTGPDHVDRPSGKPKAKTSPRVHAPVVALRFGFGFRFGLGLGFRLRLGLGLYLRFRLRLGLGFRRRFDFWLGLGLALRFGLWLGLGFRGFGLRFGLWLALRFGLRLALRTRSPSCPPFPYQPPSSGSPPRRPRNSATQPTILTVSCVTSLKTGKWLPGASQDTPLGVTCK